MTPSPREEGLASWPTCQARLNSSRLPATVPSGSISSLPASLSLVPRRPADRPGVREGRTGRQGMLARGRGALPGPVASVLTPLTPAPALPEEEEEEDAGEHVGASPGHHPHPERLGCRFCSVHGAAQPDQGAQHVPGLRAEPWAQSLALLLGGMGALHQPGSGPLSQGDHGRVTRGVDRVWYSTCNRAAGKQRGCVQSCAAPGVGTGACWA